MTAEKKRIRFVPWLLVILPIWLIASGGFALMKFFKDEKADATEKAQLFSRSVSPGSIADDLRKTVELIGERNTGRPEELAAMASMITGSLGPSNIGYEVKRINGPAGFPIIMVETTAKESGAAPLWILTSYDSPRGSRGAEKNASGLAATIAAAQALADSSSGHSIRFVFLPHANEVEAPILETALTAAKLIKEAPEPAAILCIEAMGDAEPLVLSSRDTTAMPEVVFQDLGKALGAEVVCLGEDSDLASTLFEMNLPAVRVSTRPILLPDEKDEKLPFAPTVAASAGRLVELARRIAKSP